MSAPTKLLFAVLFFAACTAQKKAVNTDANTIDRLKAHVKYLADDQLEGRRAGSNGEKLAMEYIAGEFKLTGLVPKGTDGFYQPFDILDGKQISAGSQLSINGKTLEAGKDFFPFAFSANVKTLNAQVSAALQETEMPWLYDLKETLEENKSNPHFDLVEYIYNNAKKANGKGASAILLYNSSSADDKLVFNGKYKAETLKIPVVYVSKSVAQQYFKDPAATLDIKLSTDITEKKRIGHNVVGFIDNGAANTVILGAHFDHLGYGEDGNSMLRTTDKLIHNGADDNASGTAALIELAKKLKSGGDKSSNYLFIAFSGEELGLFGSKYYTEHPTVDLKQVSYMINMDMVGRFNDSTKVLTVGGVGTSPAWGDVYSVSNAVIAKAKQGLIFKYDSSGSGPSDHTSFYRKDIPVLFYFTGLHLDYHKPTDDFDKINYNGENTIIQHIYWVIGEMNKKPRPAFTKTKEAQTSTNTSFKVTLGIMPDYTFAGTGVRADGVTDGRPAQKAGIKGGDIILQIGDHNTTTLEGYMQALGKFEKGQRAKVKYKRGNEVLEVVVEF